MVKCRITDGLCLFDHFQLIFGLDGSLHLNKILHREQIQRLAENIPVPFQRCDRNRAVLIADIPYTGADQRITDIVQRSFSVNGKDITVNLRACRFDIPEIDKNIRAVAHNCDIAVLDVEAGQIKLMHLRRNQQCVHAFRNGCLQFFQIFMIHVAHPLFIPSR